MLQDTPSNYYFYLAQMSFRPFVPASINLATYVYIVHLFIHIDFVYVFCSLHVPFEHEILLSSSPEYSHVWFLYAFYCIVMSLICMVIPFVTSATSKLCQMVAGLRKPIS